MDAGLRALFIGLITVGVLLIVFGPPIWWYRRGRMPNQKRKPIWWAIVFGVIVISGTRPTVKGDNLGWAVNIIRVEMGVWIVAWGAKGSQV